MIKIPEGLPEAISNGEISDRKLRAYIRPLSFSDTMILYYTTFPEDDDPESWWDWTGIMGRKFRTLSLREQLAVLKKELEGVREEKRPGKVERSTNICSLFKWLHIKDRDLSTLIQMIDGYEGSGDKPVWEEYIALFRLVEKLCQKSEK